jgi:hypothetical protein
VRLPGLPRRGVPDLRLLWLVQVLLRTPAAAQAQAHQVTFTTELQQRLTAALKGLRIYVLPSESMNVPVYLEQVRKYHKRTGAPGERRLSYYELRWAAIHETITWGSMYSPPWSAPSVEHAATLPGFARTLRRLGLPVPK